VTVQQPVLVDGSATWKPYRIVYEVIKALRDQDAGAVVEVITKDDPGILTDLACWCEATGHDLLSTDSNRRDEARLVIRKGAPKRSESTITVVISTANLEHAVFPLEKAVAGAVLGMKVNVVFEGAGVRLLKRGYRSRLSGLVGGLFTPMVEQVMRRQIGWPLPQETISMLQDLGAHFYVCGPSMYGYRVDKSELIVADYTIGAVLTWADLLAHSDIHVFSKAQFEKP
jgi:predicted peroxiredoxin/TusA-related sulfurtransferase